MRNQLRALCLLALFGTASAHAQFTGCLPGFCGGNSPFSTTFDPATAAATLSGRNLTGTSDGTSGTNQGAHVATTHSKTSGKYYFEFTGVGVIHGSNTGMGIGTTASTYTGMGTNATTGNEVYKNGEIYGNGADSGVGIAVIGNGTIHAVAIDLDNRKIWFRQILPSLDDWNSNAAADPATNVGGQVIPAGNMIPFLTLGGLGGNAGTDTITANFGASSFIGTVPSGFTAGWPL
jgi:hypothetical protein